MSNWCPFTAIKVASGALEVSSVGDNCRSPIRSLLTFLETSDGVRLRLPLTVFQPLVQSFSVLLVAASQVFFYQCSLPQYMFTCGVTATMRTVGSAQELCSDVSALLHQGSGFPGKSGFVPVALSCSAVRDRQNNSPAYNAFSSTTGAVKVPN